MNNLVATASTTIHAPVERVWEALTNAEDISHYMFGTKVTSDWQPGSSITWQGSWEGKPYKDKGKITTLEKNRKIEYTHSSGREEEHLITISLHEKGENQTLVALEQDNNPTEEAKEHSSKNWQMMLDTLKKYLEEK
jgi:uncharacterized protein YndB with AHSA1/START domain